MHQPNRHYSLRRACALVAATLTTSLSIAQTATWTSLSSGNWSDPTRWSTNPVYPNNGSPTGSVYDVIFPNIGSTANTVVDTNTTVRSVALNNPYASLTIQGPATFSVTNGLTLGPSNSLSFSGTTGTLSNTAVTGSGGIYSVGQFSSSIVGHLDNVSLDTPLAGTYYLHNGLTLLNNRTISPLALYFAGPQTLSGTGALLNTALIAPTTGTATIASTISLQNVALTATNGGSISVLGTLALNDPAAMPIISSSPSRLSVNHLDLSAGTLRLAASVDTFKTINWTGGSIVAVGDVSNAAPLWLDAPFHLAGPFELANSATFIGNLTADNGNLVRVTGTNTVLAGTIDADVNLLPGASLTIPGAITLNRSLTLAPPASSTAAGLLTLRDGTILDGTGQIILNSDANPAITVYAPNPYDPSPITIGPSFTLRTGPTAGGNLYYPNGTLINTGSIIADNAHSLTLDTNLLNQGTLSSSTGAHLSVSGAFVNPAGHTVTVDSAATFSLSSYYGVTKPSTNSGTISLTNNASFSAITLANQGLIAAADSAVSIWGDFANSGTLSVTGGSLTLGPTANLTNTGSISLSSSTLILAGADPLPLTTNSTFTNTSLRVTGHYTTPTLLSVPLAGNYSITVAAQGSVDNASHTIASTAATPWSLTGGSIAGGTLASSDNTPLPAVASYTSTLTGVSILSPVLVQPAATLSIAGGVNSSDISVQSGGTLALSSSFSNAGSVTLNPNSTLAVAGPILTPNPISANGATILLPGYTSAAATFTPAQLTAQFAASSSAFRVSPGGTLDLQGQTLPPLDAGNALQLAGGTLTNGTLLAPLTVNPPSPVAPSTFTNLTLRSDVTLAADATLLATNVLLDQGRISLVGSGASYTLSGDSLLAGAGEVVFDSARPPNSQYYIDPVLRTASTSLTIAPAITVRTGAGSGVVGSPGVPLTNLGTLSSQTSGQSLSIAGTTLSSPGLLEAKNGGTLVLALSNLSFASLVNLHIAPDSHLVLGGTLANTGTTLTLSADSPIPTLSGTVTGGTIASPDGSHLPIYWGATFNSVTVDVPIDATAINNLVANSTTFLQPVNIAAGPSYPYSYPTIRFGGNTTIAAAMSVTGGYLQLSDAWTLTSPLTLTNSALTFGTKPVALPGAPITLNNSTLNLYSPTPAFLNSFTRVNATVNLTGTLSNTGNVITSDASAGTIRLGSTTASGTIIGGTIVNALPGQLVIASPSTLNAITLQGYLSTESLPIIANGITFANAHVSLAASYAGATLPYTGVSSIAGTGDITFDGLFPSSISPATSGTDRLSVAAGVTLRTGAQGASLTLDSVDGTISAQTPSTSITLSATTINGTIQASNGAAIFLTKNPTNFNSPTAGTLTGGTYSVSGNSLILANFMAIRTNAATITLDGPGARFTPLASIRANSGSLTLTNGNAFTTSDNITTGLTNTGSITLGTNAALKVRNSLSNTGTISLAGGSLLIDYSTTSPIDSLRNDLLTGHLTTPLPNTAIAYFEASFLNLTTYANLPVDSTTLLTKLTLPGDINLDGKITPDDYALLDRSYAQHPSDPHWTDGDLNYDGTINQQDYLLMDTTYLALNPSSAPTLLSQRESQFGNTYVQSLLTSIPEPTSATACLFATLLLPRRRQN